MFGLVHAGLKNQEAYTPTVSIVAHVCGEPLSHHTCRATRVAAISWDFSCIAVVSCYTPPPPQNGAVAPAARQLPGVSHVKLPLKRCRAIERVAATLANVALHCATMTVRWRMVEVGRTTTMQQKVAVTAQHSAPPNLHQGSQTRQREETSEKERDIICMYIYIYERETER